MKIRHTNGGYRKTSSNKTRATTTPKGKYVYVSTNGIDSNDGSISSPVNTLTRAITIANAIVANSVSIYISAGEYFFESTIINLPKKIKIIGIGNVIINCGRHIDNIESQPNGLIRFPNSIGDKFFIMVNGVKRYTSSTTRFSQLSTETTCEIPATIETFTDTDGLKSQRMPITDIDISNLLLNDNYKRCWLTIIIHWASSKLKIRSIDSVNKKIVFRTQQNPSGAGSLYASSGQPFILENINFPTSFDGYIDPVKPGTFYSSHDGYIYYKLTSGEIFENIHVTVPSVTTVLDIKSSCEINNIKFTNSYYNLFDTEYTCSDTQSGYAVPGSIKCYGSNIRITDCEFYNMSQHCIEFLNGSAYSVVENCYFHNNGCGSVKIGELQENDPNVPRNITVSNCVVEYSGELLQQSAGIIMTFGDSCNIVNCDVSKQLYTGITSGHIWGKDTPNTYFKNCNISNNIVHHISSWKMSDLGGIYNLGASQGLKISNNIVYEVIAVGSNGIYLDEGSKDMTVLNNIVYYTQCGYFFHWANNNLVKNNISAFNRTNQYLFSGSHDCIYSNNINYMFNDEYGTIKDNYGNCIVRDNLYWNTTGTATPTHDISPIVGDPFFRNAKAYDFKITNSVNTDRINFKEIDISNVGVYGTNMTYYLNKNNDFYITYKKFFPR